MILVIKMKNATDSPKSWVGQEIQPGDYYQILSNEKESWENDAQVLSDITAGVLVVNDGYDDLFPDDGIKRLQAEAESPYILFQHPDFKAKDVDEGIIEASQQCRGVVGLCHTVTFSKPGSIITDSWLYRAGVPGNKSPAILPYPCYLKALTFSNSVSGADFDISIEIRKDVITKTLTNNIRRSRAGYLTRLPSHFDSGSQVAVYIVRKGVDPADLVVSLIFQVDADNTDYSSTFNMGDF